MAMPKVRTQKNKNSSVAVENGKPKAPKIIYVACMNHFPSWARGNPAPIPMVEGQITVPEKTDGEMIIPQHLEFYWICPKCNITRPKTEAHERALDYLVKRAYEDKDSANTIPVDWRQLNQISTMI